MPRPQIRPTFRSQHHPNHWGVGIESVLPWQHSVLRTSKHFIPQPSEFSDPVKANVVEEILARVQARHTSRNDQLD